MKKEEKKKTRMCQGFVYYYVGDVSMFYCMCLGDREAVSLAGCKQ